MSLPLLYVSQDALLWCHKTKSISGNVLEMDKLQTIFLRFLLSTLQLTFLDH